MKGLKASQRYALSLISLAQEQGVVDQVKNDMELVSAVIAENHELQRMLQSPIIKTDQKQRALTSIFEKHVQPLSIHFIRLICAKGRESFLPTIAKSVVEIYKEQKGIVTAVVTSSLALTADQRSALVAKLSRPSTTLELVERVDSNLIGGLKVRIGDQRVDATIRKKLSSLQYDIHKS